LLDTLFTYSIFINKVVMANPIIWTGTSTFAPGQTPFGFYDSNPAFASDADKVANYCARKLGYPILDVELDSGSFYACFEEAVSIYSEELYQSKIKDNYLALEGAPTSSTFNNQVIVPSLNSIITIADNYGAPAGVGGHVEWYSASLALSASQQVYDIQAWGLQQGYIQPGDSMIIQNVFYQGNPAINQYYDPYIGGSINYQGATENFGWASYSPGLNFTLFPVYWDIQRIQEIEMSNMVRRSAFTFEVINNKLKIFPAPDVSGMYIWIQYSKYSDQSNPLTNSPYSGSTGLVTNPSNVPYTTITYSQINQPGKQWIYEYTLALASELLGIIRGKYQNVPVPGETTTLNSNDLISKGQATQQALREKLRQDFEDMSRKAQLERKQSENESISNTLSNVPLLVYIG
jgi:hypothetical protein